MKLELKHLAPYLPYEIEVEVERWSYTFGQYRQNRLIITTDLIRIFQEDYYSKFLPILRPLEDVETYFIDEKSNL
jgi:hypothetical protein